jgi:hypothetical protein
VKSPVIVLEQRLRTRALALLLFLFLVLFLVVSITLIATSKSGSLPVVLYVVETVVPLGLAVGTLMFVRIVVRVVDTPKGRALEVLYGHRGFVRQVFGPDELVAAHARHYSFMQMGGWGYRGSIRLLRRAALATRRGDALDLELTRKRRFIVTVDDPADFVAALGLPVAE